MEKTASLKCSGNINHEVEEDCHLKRTADYRIHELTGKNIISKDEESLVGRKKFGMVR
jgi:hypothetical protein